MQAAKIILDRVLPTIKDKPVKIDLPNMTSSSDLLKAMECITFAVGSGQISPLEGESIARIVDTHIKALELNEIEKTAVQFRERRAMKSCIHKRLKQLESRVRINKRHKSARIVCDRKIMYSSDFSEVNADALLILPDNGRRTRGEVVPEGSYLVYYSKY